VENLKLLKVEVVLLSPIRNGRNHWGLRSERFAVGYLLLSLTPLTVEVRKWLDALTATI